MVDETSLKLSRLLGAQFNEADRLEKNIRKILQTNNTDDDDIDRNVMIIKASIDGLIKNCYGSLESIEKAKRIAFWNELNAQLERLPKRCLTEEVQSQMTLLQMVCHFDFTQRPLSFAVECIHNLDVLSGCENELLELIVKLRNQYGVINALNTQYESISNLRRKIVLVVAGGLKSGKSSFINYLVKSNVCPVGICATTARLTKITYGQPELVKLESITGELKDEYKIQSSEQFKEITEKLVALEGSARTTDSCKDIVTIQLNRKELKDIELWDVPGYDENQHLNSIIKSILKETSIIFILQPFGEGIRDTTVELLSCTESNQYQPEVCFVVTKLDQVTTNSESEKNVKKALDNTFHEIGRRFNVEIGNDWKSSRFFIPLCTDPKYNLKEFLVSHKQFTDKSTLFLRNAVHNTTLNRLKYLTETIHELFDYDDIDRSIQQAEKLSNILTIHLAALHAHIEKELKEPFTQIHQTVSRKFSTIAEPKNDEKIQQALFDEIENELSVKREQIEKGVLNCVNELYRKLEETPTLGAVIRSLGERTLYGDPYQAVIGQYRKENRSLLRAAEFYHAVPSLTSICERVPEFGNSERWHKGLIPAIAGIGLVTSFCVCPAIYAAAYSTTYAAAFPAIYNAVLGSTVSYNVANLFSHVVYWNANAIAGPAVALVAEVAASSAAGVTVGATAATVGATVGATAAGATVVTAGASVVSAVAAAAGGITARVGSIFANGISLMRERKKAKGEAEATIESSVKSISDGLRKDIFDHIHQMLCEVLNIMSAEIKRKTEKMNEQKNTDAVRHIARFLKENNSSIGQVYLNLLDQMNRFEYPYCEINLGTVLGKSNSPVYAGILRYTEGTETKNIAAKRLSPNNFNWQEVRYMTKLKHENILQYYGVRKSPDCEDFYDILMQRLDSDLTSYIQYVSKKGKINDKIVDNIFIQITTGLRYLHKNDLIHRDIKPENVLVQIRKGQSPIFVLADFGFIHRVPISIKGTEGFLAPELRTNNIDDTFITEKVDIFALGATITRTIENSRVDTNGEYVTFWAEISARCLLDSPCQRPTCENIIDEHENLMK